MVNIGNLIKYLKNHKLQLFIVFFSLTVVALSILRIGHIFSKFVDLGIENKKLLDSTLWDIVIIICIFSIFSFLRSYYINKISIEIMYDLRKDVYKTLLSLKIKDFEKTKISDYLSIFISDIQSIGSSISNFLSFFIRNFFMFLGGIILMIKENTKLSLIILVIFPLLILILIKLGKYLKNISSISLKKESDIFLEIEEKLASIEVIYIYNQQESTIKKFLKIYKKYLYHSKYRLMFRSFFFATAITVTFLSLIFVIWLGVRDIIEGKISSGSMVSFMYYSLIAIMSSIGIAEIFSHITEPIASLDRVSKILSLSSPSEEELFSNESESIIKNDNERNIFDITLQNISFFYSTRPDIKVLQDISMHIKEGQMVGIIGVSGSGKSSLAKILLKIYDYNSGRLLLGDKDIRNIDKITFNKKIIYVSQDQNIFTDSIKNNILYANPDLEQDKLSKIIEICDIKDFVDRFNLKLDTEIQQKNNTLSSGQKQKILIARALAVAPKILILDEATNAIDLEGEKKILQNIKNYLKKSTILNITHRVSSIKNFDKIFILDKGKIESVGNHNELLKKSNIYKEFYKKTQE